MSDSTEIKIRALPRGSEKPNSTSERKPGTKGPEKKATRWIVYVAIGSILAVTFVAAFHVLKNHATNLVRFQARNVRTAVKPLKKAAKGEHTDLASVNGDINDSVTRHLQDAEIKHEMMVRSREVENEQFSGAINELNEGDVAALPDPQNFGVQFDAEDSAAKVYNDLNDDASHFSNSLPVDKINAHLAQHKWLNQSERAEKIQFVGNFIRSAYDRGYEVQLDENLMVVGVRKINNTKTVNIDQVIDRLAKEGL
jgi:hypothetical protein